MPHLDAAALTEDPEGLRFLASVLDAPPTEIETTLGAGLAVPVDELSPQAVSTSPRRRRRTARLVPEAA